MQNLNHEIFMAVLQSVRSLTLLEALKILESLNSYHNIRGIYKNEKNATLMRFEDLANDTTNLVKPLHILDYIWYHGGPPGQADWRFGAVCQYVADVLLHEIIEHGEEYVVTVVYKIVSQGAP